MCPSTRLAPHRLLADRTYSKFPADRYSWYVHAGHHIVHELGLTLVHPAHPDAPTTVYPAPAALHVARAQQRPMTIRPPSPGHARMRAARLATADPTPSEVHGPAVSWYLRSGNDHDTHRAVVQRRHGDGGFQAASARSVRRPRDER
jgi:hypothetical protein